MSRILLSLFLLILLVGCTAEKAKSSLDLSKLNWGLEAQIALQKSNDVYQQAKAAGQDLTNGPCLSNALHGNADYPETMWVLDIAHNPRADVDNQPENQCSAFRGRTAYNFMELTLEGELIEIYSPYIK